MKYHYWWTTHYIGWIVLLEPYLSCFDGLMPWTIQVLDKKGGWTRRTFSERLIGSDAVNDEIIPE